MSDPSQPNNSAHHSRLAPGTVVLIALVAAAGCFAWQAARDAAQWSVLLSYAATYLRAAFLTALLPLLALLLGYSAMRPLHARFASVHPLSLTLSLALGWGILSHAVWGIAAIGSASHTNLFSPLTPLIVLVVSLILLHHQARELLRALRDRLSTLAVSLQPSAWPLISCAGFIFLVAVLAFLVFRLFFTALTPSFLYDVLEYHLPDAAHVIATGSLAPISGNSYSAMPQAVEMLFAFARLLEGGLTDFSPKLVHLFLAFSTVLLLIAVLRQFCVAPCLRVFAAIVFLCHPITFKLLTDAYIDMGPALFATAAILCFLRAHRGSASDRLHLPLAAVFSGLALSCKYPALGMVAVPFLLILAPAAYLARGDSRRASRLLFGLVALGLLIAITCSPWLLRALVYEHTPFPPLTTAWFGPQPDAPHQAIRAFMAEAHRPRAPITASYWISAVRRIPVPGTLLILGAFFALLVPRRDRRRQALGTFALFGYLVWCTRPDAADRFLAALLPLLVALAVLMIHDLARFAPHPRRHLTTLFALPLALWAVLQFDVQTTQTALSGLTSFGLGVMPRNEFLEKQLGVTAKFFEAVNKTADSRTSDRPAPKVLLLYEARFAAFDPAVVGNTVFDPSPLWNLLRAPGGDSPEAVVRALRSQGFTHIAVNEVELARLLATYPVPAAREDPAWRLAVSEAAGGVNPALLAFRRYYAPFYYFSDNGRTEETEKRLDALAAYLRPNVLWEEDIRGMRMYLATL